MRDLVEMIDSVENDRINAVEDVSCSLTSKIKNVFNLIIF